jgi:hypothetical protein
MTFCAAYARKLKSVTPAKERLRNFGVTVGRLIRKEDISRAEARECWRQICAGDLGVGQFAADGAQRGERAFLVGAHQPRIPRDISRQDRRQSPLDPLLAHMNSR